MRSLAGTGVEWRLFADAGPDVTSEQAMVVSLVKTLRSVKARASQATVPYITDIVTNSSILKAAERS